jgi:hypothetical protein
MGSWHYLGKVNQAAEQLREAAEAVGIGFSTGKAQ